MSGHGKKEKMFEHTPNKETESFEFVDEFDPRGLLVGQAVEVETKSRKYLIEWLKDGFYISGHPEYCPLPTKAEINGSTKRGSAPKQYMICKGMHLNFSVPGHKRVTTSTIKDIRLAQRTIH